MTDTNVLLLDAAKHVRALAEQAANDHAGDTLCCWDTERIGGQDRVIQVRQYPEGTDDAIVALPAEAGLAEHIAAWDPPVAQAVADLIERVVDCGSVKNMTVMRAVAAAEKLAKLLSEGR